MSQAVQLIWGIYQLLLYEASLSRSTFTNQLYYTYFYLPYLEEALQRSADSIHLWTMMAFKFLLFICGLRCQVLGAKDLGFLFWECDILELPT